ncbi:transposase [Aliiroseovarius sp. M344]|nr:transposase [Aliiroseovarius sp. M344]
MLDNYVTKRRDRSAALKFLTKSMKRHDQPPLSPSGAGFVPSKFRHFAQLRLVRIRLTAPPPTSLRYTGSRHSSAWRQADRSSQISESQRGLKAG